MMKNRSDPPPKALAIVLSQLELQVLHLLRQLPLAAQAGVAQGLHRAVRLDADIRTAIESGERASICTDSRPADVAGEIMQAWPKMSEEERVELLDEISRRLAGRGDLPPGPVLGRG